MVFQYLKKGDVVEDDEFDAIFKNGRLLKLSAIHFTPVDIAIEAAAFLANKPDSKNLDIGSGVGKFCLVAATCSNATFVGVEQRRWLFNISRKLAEKHQVQNAVFRHANIIDIDFKEFDGVYYFNSFFENLSTINAIDNDVALSRELFKTYTSHVISELDSMATGTRLVTYFCTSESVPASFIIIRSHCDGKLKMWVKE